MDPRLTVMGENGMVASNHELSSKAGMTMLQAGGTVFDAAVAVQLVKGVVQPQHVSLLGGGGMVYKFRGEDAGFLDFREEAPGLYHPKTFCANSTCLMDPQCGCDEGSIPYSERCIGAHSAGVPGVPHMMLRMLREGKLNLPLKQLAAPAIRAAARGFPMYEQLHAQIVDFTDKLARYDETADIFLNEDKTGPKVAVGERFRQPLLARAIRKFFTSEAGLESAYTGKFANMIVEASWNGVNPTTGTHGLLQAADLAGYRSVYREPVKFTHRDPDTGFEYKFNGAAMPFSGPLTNGLIFAQYGRLQKRTEDEVRRLGYWIDAQNAAFADRGAYMADADFVDVPIDGLLSETYAEKRYDELFSNTDSALETPVAAGMPKGAVLLGRAVEGAPEHGTAHFSIADNEGNVVSCTTTVNGQFGALVTVPGTGILLNNQVCDFDGVGVTADGTVTVNAAEGEKKPRRTALGEDKTSLGGKRPRSSMTPLVVEGSADAPFSALAIGAPGGTNIIGGTANVLRRIFASGFTLDQLQAAVDAPRVNAQNGGWFGSARAESAIYNQTELREELHSYGYEIVRRGDGEGQEGYMDPPYLPNCFGFGGVSAAMASHPQDGLFTFAGGSDSLRLEVARSSAPEF